MEVTYERTFKVKMSHLQILTCKFESLKIIEDETIIEYNVRVLDVEKIFEIKLVLEQNLTQLYMFNFTIITCIYFTFLIFLYKIRI